MIKKIYFEDYKGFAETELNIENITTLIGTNAAGKTNAIEGMMVLSELVSGRDLSTILDGTKNSEPIVRGGAKGCCRFGANSFGLGCTVYFDENTDLEYRIKIFVGDRVMLLQESLFELKHSQTDQNASRKEMFSTKESDRQSGNIAVSYNNGKKGRNPDIICIRFAAVIAQVAVKLPQERQYGRKIVQYANTVIDALKDILYLNPATSKMRGYASINDIDLKVDASNISAVLNNLCKDPANKEKLLGIIRQLPENEIIDIRFMDGPLNDIILALKEKSGDKDEEIDATRLSDGTLRCLAIVAAALGERLGGMVVIEEIDNGIHPGRAKALISLISSIARTRKVDVLFTTHNAVVLNGLSLEDLNGVQVLYRDVDSGDGRFVPLVEIQRIPELLANGRLGDVFSNGKILEYIKKNRRDESNYSWLGV